MMWIRKSISVRQISIPSPDITAAVVTLHDLIASVYVAKKESLADYELTTILEKLQAAVT